MELPCDRLSQCSHCHALQYQGTEKWDDEILDILSIPKAILPEVRSSSQESMARQRLFHFYGGLSARCRDGGDQQAALFVVCFEPGMVKNTYGTGSFIIMNTGEGYRIT